METNKNNILIAEFMGWFQEDEYPYDTWYYIKDNAQYVALSAKERLSFDRDWEKLMPVVEKIEGLGYSFEISREITYIKPYPSFELHFYSNVRGEHGESKIEAVFQSVISFIRWYNENK